MASKLLIAYSIYAKIMLTLMGVWIYRLRKRVKELEEEVSNGKK